MTCYNTDGDTKLVESQSMAVICVSPHCELVHYYHHADFPAKVGVVRPYRIVGKILAPACVDMYL